VSVSWVGGEIGVHSSEQAYCVQASALVEVLLQYGDDTGLLETGISFLLQGVTESSRGCAERSRGCAELIQGVVHVLLLLRERLKNPSAVAALSRGIVEACRGLKDVRQIPESRKTQERRPQNYRHWMGIS
jgi:hypothetical protein